MLLSPQRCVIPWIVRRRARGQWRTLYRRTWIVLGTTSLTRLQVERISRQAAFALLFAFRWRHTHRTSLIPVCFVLPFSPRVWSWWSRAYTSQNSSIRGDRKFAPNYTDAQFVNSRNRDDISKISSVQEHCYPEVKILDSWVFNRHSSYNSSRK